MALGMWDPRGSRQDLRSTGGQGAPTGITGGGSLGIDSSDLQTLHIRLGTVITDVGKLDAAVQKLAKSLSTAGGAWGGVSGGKSGIANAGGTLSTASFGTPLAFSGASKAPIFGAGGGNNGGNKNTTAPVSGGSGAATRMIALGAMGEVGAGMAGSINSGMNTITAAGMATDTMASQTAGIFGGGTKAGTVNGMTGFSNMGSNDLNKAMATLMSNPMLFPALKQGSQQQKGLQGFMNTLQKLNPTMGAAGAAGTANQLVSGPTLQALQRLGSRNGQLGQGLVNPSTMGVNSTSRIFSEMMQAVTGGKQLSAGQLKSQYGSGAQATRNWTMIGQNNNVPGMGLGLSPQMLTELRQYAAAGGNLSKAEAAQQGTVAGSALFKSSAKTKFQETTFQKTSGEQITENKAAGDMYNMMTRLTADGGPLPNLIAGAASAARYLLSIGSHVAGGAVLYKGAKTLLGGSGGIAGAAGSVMGGPSGGGPMPSGGGPAANGSQSSPFYIRGSNETGNTWPVVVQLDQTSLTSLGHLLGGGGSAAPKKTKTSNSSGSKKSSSGGGQLSFWDHLTGKNDPTGATGQLWQDTMKDLPLVGALLGDPPTGSTSTKGMAPSLSSKVKAMMSANPNLKITSGHRTSQQQANLYALKGGQGVAKPGHSQHQAGKAADIGPRSQLGWVAKNAKKFGLYHPAPKSEPWHVESMGDPPAVTGAAIVSTAQTQAGVPYSWGGGTTSGPSKGIAQGANTVGFDCSHFVQYVFAQHGISVPPPSQSQAKMGKAVNGLSAAQAGDLLFYNYEGPNSHVAIYIGGGKQIAAPQTGQVIAVQSVDTGHLDAIRRIISGGAGSSVVATAQASVGQPSNDSHGSGGSNIGLGNSFLSMVSGLGGMEGSPAGGGGGGTAAGASQPTAGAAPSSASGAGASSAAVPTSGTLSSAQVQAAWIKAGGPAGVAKTMAGIAMAESGDQPGITQKGQPYSTTGWGLWQITPGNSEPQVGTDNALLDPVTNAKAALAKYRGAGNTLRPWTGDHYLTQNNINPSSSGIGDPVGSGLEFAMMGDPPSGGGGMIGAGPAAGGSVSAFSGGTGHGNIYLTMPIQVSDGNPQDASRFANMVVDAIERRTGMKVVQES